ncbi:29814_t:CDS:2 [Gigaspora margarita]|uniref:29814_t:CDS:1 n=1 Tax=Gigaspora margarita TaxID=4874 RepID=A0ABM8VYN2_GIGMA|nr:29814_t:CDS:2 [Gigaspora margarita]
MAPNCVITSENGEKIRKKDQNIIECTENALPKHVGTVVKTGIGWKEEIQMCFV